MISRIFAFLDTYGKVASLTVDLILLVVAIVSAICAFKSYRTQKEREKKAAACNLAKFYADDILEDVEFITRVFVISDLKKYIESNFSPQDFKNFDKDELLTTLKKLSLSFEDVSSRFAKIDPQHILQCKIYLEKNVQQRGAIIDAYTIPRKSDNSKKCYDIINPSFLQDEISDVISKLLNKLEWFSMNCKYGVADEKLIYQSLHQTFFSTIWMLYFYICRVNDSNEDKFYTNIIWLFDLWFERFCKITSQAEAEKNKAAAKLAKAQKNLENAKPKVFAGSALK